jgi:hypothetical protein
MRTTVALDDDLVRIAQEFTGITEKTALIREAFMALIELESACRLTSLGGNNVWVEEYFTASRAKPTCRRIDLQSWATSSVEKKTVALGRVPRLPTPGKHGAPKIENLDSLARSEFPPFREVREKDGHPRCL